MMVFVSDDQVIGYEMKGHSGYAEAGQDIVCAAVSVLAQTGANALETLTGREPEVHMEDGYLQVMLPENLKEPEQEQAKIIFGTILVGLKDLVDVYPEYVELRYREV
jgi:hypothetical protein